MAESKRKSQAGDDRRKKKYRSDGTPIWGKRHVEGPGVWVSCVKGKEKQAVGEVYELFESIGSDLWPAETSEGKDSDDEEDDAGLSLEDQIAKELSDIKRPRGANPQQRFANCQTNTQCVLFISCKPPVDPVELVVKHIKTVQETGVAGTRYIQRLVPVSGSCVANPPEIQALCERVLKSFFDKHPDTTYTYKIELRVRNHNTVPRPTLIQTIAQAVPEGHKVDLDNPQLFILVEVFKSICGVSVVEDYYKMQKFNVMEIVNKKNRDDKPEESRVFPGASKLPQTGSGNTTTEKSIDESEQEVKADVEDANAEARQAKEV
ncbi:hypothetical protein BDN70DRAFT_880092 [Pholiota conissans]|uniref:THUMP domain-containing protein n=1 Tax=Pholiota conissans TaxID=109636 RepID=A0A9P5Z217_9AGAR|nr:hypothetical protein BDN70DRAFT_880092 [Pholiota conissans]